MQMLLDVLTFHQTFTHTGKNKFPYTKQLQNTHCLHRITPPQRYNHCVITAQTLPPELMHIYTNLQSRHMLKLLLAHYENRHAYIKAVIAQKRRQSSYRCVPTSPDTLCLLKLIQVNTQAHRHVHIKPYWHSSFTPPF